MRLSIRSASDRSATFQAVRRVARPPPSTCFRPTSCRAIFGQQFVVNQPMSVLLTENALHFGGESATTGAIALSRKLRSAAGLQSAHAYSHSI